MVTKPTPHHRALRLGLIGAGATRIMYAPVLPVLCETTGAELIAIADPSPEQRALFAAVLPIDLEHQYDDAESMIQQESLDAVLIASPPFLHAEHTELAASHGLHLYCEKPMARMVSEAQHMVDVCAKHRVVLGVGFNRRAMPAMARATQMVQSGTLGDVFYVEAVWTSWTAQHSAGWRDDRACMGGMFQDHGAHTIDLATQWLGPAEHASAQAQRLGPMLGVQRDVEDHMAALIRHGQGKSSLHVHTRTSHRPISEMYRVYGSTGTLELEFTGDWAAYSSDPFEIRLYREGQLQRETPLPLRTASDPQTGLTDAQYGYYRTIADWVLAIQNPGQGLPFNTGVDGLANVQAVSACYVSAAEQQSTLVCTGERFNADTYQNLLDSMSNRAEQA